ncbi:MAG: sulfate adenylyltransferase [Campylobacterales bacterium]|nr:sulfate adenylyltransferase [Campylobacterales bacterium]
MASQKQNKTLYIDQEAISTLSMVKEGLLAPVTKLMNKQESNEVDKTKLYKNHTFPFSFILAPSGKKNEEVLKSLKSGEIVDLVNNGKKYGELKTQEVFEIDPLERVKNIFATTDTTHPGVHDTLKRLGKYAICGDYEIYFDDIKEVKNQISQFKESIEAKSITCMMMAAKPFHRVHERLIRLELDKSDMLVIFLLKPYKKDIMPYSLRYKTIDYFVKNYLPTNRVLIVPLENTYIFAGNNEIILNSIVAKNFGCNKIVIGKNHAGLGMYYDKDGIKSVYDTFKGIDIDIDISNEYVYCNECKTLVSVNTCPHGQHHHISYRSDSILELYKLGLLPPAVLVRKEISAIILSELFPNRFKNLEKLYYDFMPFSGLLENHNEKDFYIELMKLYQTTSLT